MSTIKSLPLDPAIRSEVTVPAGTYVVGDPCYSFHGETDNLWMPWLEAADYEIPSRNHVLAAEIDGRVIVGVSTAYGDGTYQDQHEREYWVDAGLIGLVPIEFVGKKPNDGTHVVTFDRPAKCYYHDGVVVLGDIAIDTDW